MQLGAYFAGVAIENSMLGATHACANPLTARYGITHGLAIALLLPSVVRWNASAVSDRYHELVTVIGISRGYETATETLAIHLKNMAMNAGFPKGLGDLGVLQADLQSLSEDAAQQWTGRFNPKVFDAAGALEIYEMAY
jgi:alcohol dehydrogenase